MTVGEPQNSKNVVRVVAVTCGFPELLPNVKRQLESIWGPIQFQSELVPFDQTDYYRDSMGENLQKQLLAFCRLADPGELSFWKLSANHLESLAKKAAPVSRPVNIDPGYLTEAKFVLASTKDRDHRIYLGNGIYGEITLYFHKHQWQSSRWTYPDFREPTHHAFLTQCRDYLRQQMHEPSA